MTQNGQNIVKKSKKMLTLKTIFAIFVMRCENAMIFKNNDIQKKAKKRLKKLNKILAFNINKCSIQLNVEYRKKS